MSVSPIVDRSLAVAGAIPIGTSRRATVGFIGLVLLAAGLLAASVLTGAARAEILLTESEYLRPLDADHPAVLSRARQLAQAEGERARAGKLPNPTLAVEHEAPADQVEQTTFTLEWQPPLDGKRGLAVDAGEAAVEAARHDLQWAQLSVRQELRAVFADWAAAERRRELVARHFESLRELQDRLETRAQRGEESTLAARRFALAVSQVRGELARAEADLAKLRAEARTLRDGLSDEVRPVLPPPPEVPSKLGDTSRPDLRALEGEVTAATLRRRLAGRVLEFPSLMVGWTRISESEESFDGPYLGLSWSPPLFDRNQGDRAQLEREIAIAESRLTLLQRRAVQQKAAALAAYRTLHANALEVADVVATAPAVVDAASASFLAGESSMTDLLETLRSVLESQLAALDLHVRALSAHRQLELSAGRVLTRGDS